jgi:hypothetical protein
MTTSDGTSQQISSLSRATLGLSFSSLGLLKIKLFKPEFFSVEPADFLAQAFQAIIKNFGLSLSRARLDYH